MFFQILAYNAFSQDVHHNACFLSAQNIMPVLIYLPLPMYTRRAFAQKKKTLSLSKKLIIGICIVLIYLFFWVSWTGDVGIKAYKKVTIPA